MVCTKSFGTTHFHTSVRNLDKANAWVYNMAHVVRVHQSCFKHQRKWTRFNKHHDRILQYPNSELFIVVAYRIFNDAPGTIPSLSLLVGPSMQGWMKPAWLARRGLPGTKACLPYHFRHSITLLRQFTSHHYAHCDKQQHWHCSMPYCNEWSTWTIAAWGSI